jgi:glycosyltransferase involved in cell wall biosynthesis
MLRQYCLAARKLGERFEVASLDACPDSPIASEGVPVHALGPGRSQWCYAPRARRWFDEHVADYDAVVVHGLHQYHTLAVWRACRAQAVPYFVVPHGMLGPWFRKASPWRHLRKWLFWPWQDYGLLRDAAAVIFSCEQEARDAPHTFWPYAATATVSRFGIAESAIASESAQVALATAHPQLAGRRFLLFLGRLHPVKGCDLLIEAFSRIAACQPDLDLVLAGPDPGSQQDALSELASRLGVARRIHWTGPVAGPLKAGLLKGAEALVLPSHHENFGMVVVEALSCATPVLLSTGVNIWREVVDEGAGLAAPHDLAGVHQLLLRWIALDATERGAMRRSARRAYIAHFQIDEAARGFVSTVARHLKELSH